MTGKVKELVEKLEKGIKEIFSSEQYMEYLLFMSRFHHYSAGNVLLIKMQKPDATLVAGLRAWNQLGRYVIKGETGIKILAPCIGKPEKPEKSDDDEEPMKIVRGFRTVTVFDISQTAGDDVPILGCDELIGSVEGFDRLKEALVSVAGIPIFFESFPGGAKGYYSPGSGEIHIQSGMSEVQTMKTLIHEITHSRLHNKSALKDRSLSRSAMETEAESTAFVVSSFFGISVEDYSFSYIAGWSADKELSELKASLELIQKTSTEMIDEIQKELQAEPHVISA